MNSAEDTDFITDQDDENESLLIHDIARLIKKNFDRRVRDLGLTRSQWLTISIMRRNPGISQTELADKLDVEPITVARTLDRLEKSGWVERRADSQDRRINRIYLTSRVKDVVAQIRTQSLEMRHEVLENISLQEHRALLETLKKMKKNMCTKNKGKTC